MVRIFYEELVEGIYLRVYDEHDRRVDDSDARITLEDPSAPVAHKAVYEVDLKPLPKGTYTVEYLVTGLDGHPVSDSYSFRVGAGIQNAAPGGRTLWLAYAMVGSGLLVLGGVLVMVRRADSSSSRRVHKDKVAR